jgi:hypothetical protein
MHGHLFHHPFIKPPLNPSIEEGAKKKTEQRRKIGGFGVNPKSEKGGKLGDWRSGTSKHGKIHRKRIKLWRNGSERRTRRPFLWDYSLKKACFMVGWKCYGMGDIGDGCRTNGNNVLYGSVFLGTSLRRIMFDYPLQSWKKPNKIDCDRWMKIRDSAASPLQDRLLYPLVSKHDKMWNTAWIHKKTEVAPIPSRTWTTSLNIYPGQGYVGGRGSFKDMMHGYKIYAVSQRRGIPSVEFRFLTMTAHQSAIL